MYFSYSCHPNPKTKQLILTSCVFMSEIYRCKIPFSILEKIDNFPLKWLFWNNPTHSRVWKSILIDNRWYLKLSWESSKTFDSNENWISENQRISSSESNRYALGHADLSNWSINGCQKENRLAFFGRIVKKNCSERMWRCFRQECTRGTLKYLCSTVRMNYDPRVF